MTTAAPNSPLTLEIRDVSIRYTVGGETMRPVRNVSFSIEPGQTYGLIGESGSGKSSLAFAVMRYLSGGETDTGHILFESTDINAMSSEQLSELRGNRVAMVYQDALAALNPGMRVGDQIAEALRRHCGMNRRGARLRALELLAEVNLADAGAIARRYPHQLSGGQQQRVVIAMAIACKPALLIMDEPTTALDVTTEAVILELVARLREQTGMAILFISHNLAVVSKICDRVGVLYAGRLVEEGDIEAVLQAPKHPYTRALLDCLPQPGLTRKPLLSTPGTLPDPRKLPPGCIFAPRCRFAQASCETDAPAYRESSSGHRRLCHFELDLQPARVALESVPTASTEAPVYLAARGLSKTYGRGRKLFRSRRAAQPLPALDNVSCVVPQGRTTAIVGESGSGKSTLARLIMGLVDADKGELVMAGRPLASRLARRSHAQHRDLQIVFQNPESALNPLHTVREAIERPLRLYHGLRGAELQAKVEELLTMVKLDKRYADRYPRQLSGGEKQRVSIARAFAADPAVVVCDEPTSALDISVQAAILNQLLSLQREKGTSYVFISHDLAVVRYVSDHVVVMYRGRVVESGPTEVVFEPPHHPYTEALIAAIPVIGVSAATPATRMTDTGAVSSQEGCIYSSRCARRVGEMCDNVLPPLRRVGDGRTIACHISVDELRRVQRRSEISLAQAPQSVDTDYPELSLGVRKPGT